MILIFLSSLVGRSHLIRSSLIILSCIVATGEEKSADRFEVFERWLKDNAILSPKLELRDYGDEVRGCHSTNDIMEDDIIIEVPLQCLITVEMGKETEVHQLEELESSYFLLHLQ